MKYVPLFVCLNFLLISSCGQTQDSSNIDSETSAKLEGEWSTTNDWREDVLIFKDKNSPKFEQEIFPIFNTIVFDEKNHHLTVNTYGEFGCGTAAVQNLNMENMRWILSDGKVRLKGNYSDYSGEHTIDKTYSINRVDNILTLTLLKEK